MEKKVVELNQREAVMLSTAIRAMGGSYLKEKKKRGKTALDKEKCDAYADECLAIAKKIEIVFGMKPASITDDGNKKLF